MPVLTLIHCGASRQISFSQPQKLQAVLNRAGILFDHPCGGRGVCGKCAVKLEGCISPPNEAELNAGTRLSCQAELLGDATVWLPGEAVWDQIEVGASERYEAPAPMAGSYGAAVDIGTTTVALTLCRLRDGKVLASSTCENPQRSVAADVIGRIESALSGGLPALQEQITSAIQTLLKEACEKAEIPEIQVESFVITGNTTMLYLLTGKDPDSLARAPFRADCLFGLETEILGRKTYLPPCMDAFVGADITCAVLASKMTVNSGPVLLCDIGTNGEIALWKEGKLTVTSTAAGPAFEGAGISCGCGSIRGAIDKVWLEGDQISCHTIGDAPAVGVCGSGLIDSIAAFLQRENIDETGAVDVPKLELSNGVGLLPKDIRAVQLAKAAIAAGIQTLLEDTATKETQITRFYICGGFGAHLNLESAAAIGLIPESFAEKTKVLGNAALTGAIQLLLDCSSRGTAEMLAAKSVHLNLGGNPKFNANYIEHMLFPDIFDL